ncbi:MAG: MMPL family transporter [Sandaracinaceae bacterium]|nr:MMPL family transporter [Sandaracinaceae bacterium]
MPALIDAIAELVTRRRGAVLGAIVVVTLAAGAFIPSLVADPRPQQLTTSSIEDQNAINALFAERFGNPDHVVVLLVEADDVLAPAPLAYVHGLARRFEQAEYVTRVEGITVTPLPIPIDADEAPPDAGTLDDLDDLDEDGADEDAGESGDEGPPAAPDEPEVDPALEDALGVIVRSDPARFPLGLATVADRVGAYRYGPVVSGDLVTEADHTRLMRVLEDAPMVTGRLISRDRRVTAVALFLDARVEDHRVMERTVEEIDRVVASLPPPAGVRVTTGGLPHLFNSIIDKMEEDNFRIVPLTLLVCLVLLYVSFRWLPGTLLPVVAVGISAVIVLGAMAMVGETMTVLNNIVPSLLIIIGVSDSIHLIGRYREELEHAPSPLVAARNTVRSMAVACFLTSITTSVGLASLIVSRTEMLQRFGVIAAIGVMIAYVVTIGFLPSAMTYFRPPPLSREKSPYRDPAERDVPAADRGLLESAIVWLTSQILAHPWRFLAGALVLVGLFVWTALRITVDSALLDEFDEDDAAYVTTRLMEDQLDGVRPLEIMLESERPGAMTDPAVLAAIDAVQAHLERERAVLSTASSTDYLHAFYARLAGDPAAAREPFRSEEQVGALLDVFATLPRDPVAPFVTTDRRAARIQVRLADVGAAASLRLIEELRLELDERFRPLGVRVALTGEGYTGSVGLTAVVNDLLGSLSTAVLIIFGMLVVLLGSWRLGLLSIPPNVIPLVGTLAWMSMRGMHLNASTVIVFSISLGLAVDGSIHVLARYREEIGLGLDRDAALLRAARGTGRAVVISCVTLMVGFGVMLLSSFVPVQRFGELVGVTVGMCLLSTLIVQPALLAVFAPATPPNRFRRKHASKRPAAGAPAGASPEEE